VTTAGCEINFNLSGVVAHHVMVLQCHNREPGNKDGIDMLIKSPDNEKQQ
jgi:hypothetical protein